MIIDISGSFICSSNVCYFMRQVKVPLYGCDCYAYGLLASGHADLVIEHGLKVFL
jgi:fructose-1,6-bisphosphatase/inositol monophosphatase family enzyme